VPAAATHHVTSSVRVSLFFFFFFFSAFRSGNDPKFRSFSELICRATPVNTRSALFVIFLLLFSVVFYILLLLHHHHHHHIHRSGEIDGDAGWRENKGDDCAYSSAFAIT
jgi:hypothetical protein